MKRISISTIRTITKKTEFVDSIKTASIVPMALKENIQNVLFELKETIFFSQNVSKFIEKLFFLDIVKEQETCI